MHHAFDEVLDQLDVESERAHAGDVAVELVADLVRHEADLLPLHELPLRIVGAALPLRVWRAISGRSSVSSALRSSVHLACRDSRSVRWTTRSG